MRVPLLFALFRLYGCKGQQHHEERLVTSFPHRMLLRPARGEMNKKSLRSLEDAIANTLLLQQRKEGYQYFFDNEVAVQEIVHIEAGASNSIDAGSTRVQFFVSGITFLNETEDELQELLGTLLTSSFTLEGSLRHFLFLLRSDSILGETSTVSVRPLPVNTNSTVDQIAEDEPSGRVISTLDIILICMSGLILLGIVYMVVQHHTDRGYIENERLVLFNRRQNPASASGNDKNTVISASGSGSSSVKEGLSTGNRPTREAVHGTMGTSDVLEYNSCHRTSHTNGAVKTSESTIARSSGTAAGPEHCLSPYRRFLSEKYKAKWSHPKRALSLLRRNMAKSASVFMEGDNDDGSVEGVFEDKSDDDSVDLFNVDIGSLSEESKSNAASTVSEWMKTIRVVSAHTDRPVIQAQSPLMSGFVDYRGAHTVFPETISPSVASSSSYAPSSALSVASSEASSSGFSTGTSSSSDDDSVFADVLSKLSHMSVDELSLEQSMASSIIKEKMEV